jgi:hypothetical protein
MKAGVTKTHNEDATSGVTLTPRVIPETICTPAQNVGFWRHRTQKMSLKAFFFKSITTLHKQKSLPRKRSRLLFLSLR